MSHYSDCYASDRKDDLKRRLARLERCDEALQKVRYELLSEMAKWARPSFNHTLTWLELELINVRKALSSYS